jgi:RES domain/HEPN/RES N-terminal domain 1
MADSDDLLCWECVSDKVVRSWIRETGHAGECVFCGKRRVASELSDVAEMIDGVIRKFYRPSEESAHFVSDSDNPQYWADGESAAEIIQEIAGVEPAIAEAVDDLLSISESRDVHHGADAYYGGVPLEHVDTYTDEFMEIWLKFENRLKHQVRFFDEDGKRLLDDLFADLPTLADGKAIVTIEPGGDFSTLYRARIVADDSAAEAFVRDPGRHLGPPPPNLARAGRMNPAGIPAFYGAFAEDVAIAEVRPPVGSIVAVGKFSLLRPIRLLDVSFLPFAYHEESAFSSTYDHLRNKVGFLERFHRRISRPVLPSDEALAYLPTQAVAAYVANVMGLDGVIYGSIQIGAESEGNEQIDRKLCNIALFGAAAVVAGVKAEPAPNDEIESLPEFVFPGFPAPVRNDVQVEATTGALASASPAQTAAATAVPAVQDQPNEGANQPPHEPAAPTYTTADQLVDASAKLRAEPQPRLIKIRSIKVETSSMFAHLDKDGRVIIDDFEDND